MAMVFICYRRDDSSGTAGRVHDRLTQKFGDNLVFMDVDNIPLGSDFVKVLRDAVSRCDVLLAVIGKHWLDARNADGSRRLDDKNDYVHIEIATALQRDIPVIPILVDGAAIPNAVELPEDLKGLVTRNALDVRHGSFQFDMDRLINGLNTRMGGATAASVTRTASTSVLWTATLEQQTWLSATWAIRSSNEAPTLHYTSNELSLDGNIIYKRPRYRMPNTHFIFTIKNTKFDLFVSLFNTARLLADGTVIWDADQKKSAAQNQPNPSDGTGGKASVRSNH